MTNHQELIVELRRLGVLPTEVKGPRKMVAKLLEEAEDLTEKAENPIEED
jgi:hypothetical protein